MAKNNVVYFPGNKKVKQNYSNPAAVTTNNEKLVEKLNAFMDEKNTVNMAAFVNELYRAEVICAVDFDAQMRALPRIIKDPNGNVLQPVFTDVQSLPPKDKLPHQGVVKMKFMNIVNNMLGSTGINFTGLCVNFMKQGLTLTMPLLQVIKAFDEDVKAGKVASDAEFTIDRMPKMPPNPDKVSVIKDGKEVVVDKSEIDPQMTVDIKNPEVKEGIKKFRENNSAETLNALINALVKTHVLVPARFDEQKRPAPFAIKNSNGETVQPVFAEKEDINDSIKADVIMNVPFMAVISILCKNKDQIEGLFINPFTEGVMFKEELLEKILEVEANKKAVAQPKSENVSNIGDTQVVEETTESAYRFEQRMKFDFDCLPKEFFKDAEMFVSNLIAEKENYIDSIFENAYEDVRKYPYLTEEFSVNVLGIEETSKFVFIQMPSQDNFASIAKFIFMYINEDGAKRYLAQVSDGKGNVEIVEISESGEKTSHIVLADEGAAKINDVLNIINGK